MDQSDAGAKATNPVEIEGTGPKHTPWTPYENTPARGMRDAGLEDRDRELLRHRGRLGEPLGLVAQGVCAPVSVSQPRGISTRFSPQNSGREPIHEG